MTWAGVVVGQGGTSGDKVASPGMDFADRSLPRLESTWTGARRPLPGEDLHQVAWIDEATGQVRCLAGVPPQAGPEVFWDALMQGVVEPQQGSPGLPRGLVVEEASVRDYLQGLLEGAGIPVILASGSLAGEALKVTGQRLARATGYLDRQDADPQAVDRFFQAAARFAGLEPWMALEDSDLVVLEGLAESPLVASVLGGGTPDQGLALFTSSDQLRAFLEDPAQVRLFLQFAPPEVAGPVVQAELARHGWALANPDSIPVAACPADPQPFAGPADLALLVQAMQAVEAFLESDLPGRPDIDRKPLTLADGTPFHVSLVRFVAAPPPARRPPGRNEPCWCGSGLKYKRCHLDPDRLIPG